MERANRSCLAIGDPCIDVIAAASDHILDRFCDEHGGSTLVDSDQQEQILRMLKEPQSAEGNIGHAVVEVAGGSAANVMVCVAMLEPGISCHFAGAVGDDVRGQEFKTHLERKNITPHLEIILGKRSAVCCCLISEDGQRTMFTCLGASSDLAPPHLPLSLVPTLDLVHCEGYMLFKPQVLMASARAARDAGVMFSLDLASFEVVRGCAAALKQVLTTGCVDVVFCNEDEAEAVCKISGTWSENADTARRGPNDDGGVSVAQRAGAALLKHCRVAVITSGPKGAYTTSVDQGTAKYDTESVEVVDTVGAGDAFCGAFLAGLLQQAPLQACLQAGCLAGTCAVQHKGAMIPEAEWPQLRRRVRTTLWPSHD